MALAFFSRFYALNILPDGSLPDEAYGAYNAYGLMTAGIDSRGYTFPVYFDMDLSAASVYGASSLPATAFINADGELVHGQLGMMSEETLYGHIKKILVK